MPPVNTSTEPAQAMSRRVVQPQTRLKPDAILRLVADYLAGQTTYELAAAYNVHRHTVTRHLRKAGIRLRLDGLTAEQVDEAVQLYTQGWSLARVASRLGVTADTVRARLLERGIRTRDSHGREPLR